MSLSVIPDAFIHLLIKTPKYTDSYPLLIEVDRSSEVLRTKDQDKVSIENKIENYLAFTNNFRGGEYQKRFNVKSGTIVWFITGDIRRLLNIRDVIEEVLTQNNLKEAGQFFYLNLLDDATTHNTVFLEPSFYTPYQGDKLLPLLAHPPPAWMDEVNDTMIPQPL